MNLFKKILNVFSKQELSKQTYTQEESDEHKQEYLKKMREDDPHRQDVTKEDFYKRILHEDYKTFGYYYVSGHTPKEETNIWVHNIDESSNWDTRIKFSESDINQIMTTDEFKEMVESQNYETNNSVMVVGDILKEKNIPFVFDQVILD
tara:strand:- start:25 stop:471 length:447 start_codon:yes stop_codon:yes gene_type:complete